MGGQSYSVATPMGFAVTEGSHRVTWILDPNSALTESNETNNQSQMGWTAMPQCLYSVRPISQVFSFQASVGSIQIATNSGCSWSSTAPADWVTIMSSDVGVGSGTVYFQVSENHDANGRTTSFHIAQQLVSITQEGRSIKPSISVSPSYYDFGTKEVK
jgi:hypothetical protein